MPLRCVTDTNIWIDLRVGGLLSSVFELDAVWMIPDLLFGELEDPSGERLTEWGLEHRALSGDEIERLVALGDCYLRPSQVDLATLVLAEAEEALLITGDRSLREAARDEGIEVHGTIWVVDQLVRSNTVARPEAARGLERLTEPSLLKRERANRRYARRAKQPYPPRYGDAAQRGVVAVQPLAAQIAFC